MSEAHSYDLVPGRSCGTCSMCCKLFDIDWLDRPKPAGRWCHHCRPGSGCAIWSSRPSPCATFFCMWRRLAALGDEWRPDRAGFIISQAQNAHQWNVTVDPTRPGAWEREPFRNQLSRTAGTALENGEVVVLRIGSRQLILSPQGVVPVPPGRRMQDIIATRGPDGAWAIVFPDEG